MKIAIIYRLSRYNRQSFSVLRGALEKDGVPESIDTFFLRPKDRIEEVERMSGRYERSVICYSFTTPQAATVREEIAFFRGTFPLRERVILLAGGPHPSGAVEETLDMGFDFVVKGEGEVAFPAFIRCATEAMSPRGIEGTVFKETGKVISHPSLSSVDLDLFPPFAPRSRMFAKIEISRGCPFGCRFCQTSYLMGFTMRHRSISQVVRYGKIMVERGLKDVHFVSPNALAYGSEDGRSINHGALEGLLSELRREAGSSGKIHLGSYPSEIRPEMVTREAIALIKKYCDNRYLLMGAQSGSPRLLLHLKRGHTIDAVYEAVDVTLSFGFKTYVDFIFGLPGETDEDRELTLRAIRELTVMGAVIHGHAFMPLAGTPFANEPPSPIQESLRSELKKLASRAKLFGQWETQERLKMGIHPLCSIP